MDTGSTLRNSLGQWWGTCHRCGWWGQLWRTQAASDDDRTAHQARCRQQAVQEWRNAMREFDECIDAGRCVHEHHTINECPFN